MGSKVEENLARKLASNDLPTRTKAFKRLKKWMAARSSVENVFTELEFLKLWKGLFVCMWHSDKPLVQEELAGNIACLVDVFHTPDTALDFVDVFFTTMAREWHGIDRLRLDKFYMLIRKVIHQCFNLLHKNGWEQSLVDKFVSLMEAGPLNQDISKTTLGIQLHVVEVYLPQLLAVIGGREVAADGCPSSQLLQLLHPFTQLLANTRDHSVMESVCSNVMEPLLDGGENIIESLHLDVDDFSTSLRSLAISRSTVGRNRKTLYNYCKRFGEHGAEVKASTEEVTMTTEVEQEYSKQSTLHSTEEDVNCQPPAKKKRRKRNNRS